MWLSTHSSGSRTSRMNAPSSRRMPHSATEDFARQCLSGGGISGSEEESPARTTARVQASPQQGRVEGLFFGLL
ncbi:MAG: hypothetical protein MZV64_34990 [Ignavibacteriales bacterium]|nr:hypothetical protein [Ignavibacteriales bacterium]